MKDEEKRESVKTLTTGVDCQKANTGGWVLSA